MVRSTSPSKQLPSTSFLRVPPPLHRLFLRLWIYTHPSPDASDTHRLPLSNPSYRSSSKTRRQSGTPGLSGRYLTSPTSRFPFRLRKRFVLVMGLSIGYLLAWTWYQLHYNWALNVSVRWRDKNSNAIPYRPHYLRDSPPLSGCFDPERMRVEMPAYNITKERNRSSRSRHHIESGVTLDQGMTCYDFAGSIRPDPELDYPSPSPSSRGVFEAWETDEEILTYHTYWRSDLRHFGSRQEATVRSFLATQHLPLSRLIIWTNSFPTLLPTQSAVLTQLLLTYSTYIEIRELSLPMLTAGTVLEGHEYISSQAVFDDKAWVDGDVVRLLVLWRYGGLWFDMDEILVRDLRILAGHEFVSQWDCRDDPNLILNGAIMSFRKQSPYLCEAFHLMSTSPPPSPNSLDWGSFLYARLLRGLLASSIQPFSVIPWCLVDPLNCRQELSFPDPFESDPVGWRGKPWISREPIVGDGGVFQLDGKADMEKRLGQVFSVHVHNRWESDFPADGWAARLVAEQHERLRAVKRDD